MYFLDSIDTGQNRKAIQEAEKLLKKNPNIFAAKVNYGLFGFINNFRH